MKEVRTLMRIAPYGYALHLRIVNDLESEIQRALNGKPIPTGNRRACYIHDLESPEGAMIYPAKSLHYAEIQHETFHAAIAIPHAFGRFFDPDNHEDFAYLQTDLFEWVVREAKKAKIQIS